MTYSTIIVERDGAIGTITLNRPEVLNAMSLELCRELGEAVVKLDQDPEMGVIIFTGAGDKAFSSGADPGDGTSADADDAASPEEESIGELTWRIASSAKPTIGAINGLAYGSAAVLAASFDIRVGCERTSFRFLSARGRVNATWSLPVQVGWPTAKELLLTARVVDAKEAFRMGLVNHLVACDQIVLKATELAKQIEANDPQMVMRITDLLRKGVGKDLAQMHDNELGAE